MYKVAEMGPQRLPWLSDWRFGQVESVTGTLVTLSPWPAGSEHPLVTAWHVFHGTEETSKVRGHALQCVSTIDSTAVMSAGRWCVQQRPQVDNWPYALILYLLVHMGLKFSPAHQA